MLMKNIGDLKEFTNRLKEYNVNAVEINRIKNEILGKKNILICVGIVVVSLMISSNMLKDRGEKTKKYQSDIEKLEEKVAAMEEFDKVHAELQTYLNSLDEGAGDFSSLITTVNEIAINNNIQILAFTPQRDTSNDFYSQISASLNIASQEYADIGFFIHELETAKKNIRIEKWSAGTPTQRGGWTMDGQGQTGKDEFYVQLEISSVAVKKGRNK